MRQTVRLLLVGVLAITTALVSSLAVTSVAAAEPPAEFSATNCEHISDSVYRLYQAAFGRAPDATGFNYWLNRYESGEFPLRSQTGYFIASPEFALLYGDSPSNEEFVDNLYLNVLGRAGDVEGRSYWLDQLGTGLSRTLLLLAFSESPENVTRTETVTPMLGSFNAGLPGPWDCEQPSCTVSHDSLGAVRVSYSAVSVRSTKDIAVSIETRVLGEDPVLHEFPLGHARSGERMGGISSVVEATSCEVVAVGYDPAPHVGANGECQILPPTGNANYDVAIDFVTDGEGDATLSVAVRDADGNRLATGRHLFSGSVIGTRITERVASYPVSDRVAGSCEILAIVYGS